MNKEADIAELAMILSTLAGGEDVEFNALIAAPLPGTELDGVAVGVLAASCGGLDAAETVFRSTALTASAAAATA